MKTFEELLSRTKVELKLVSEIISLPNAPTVLWLLTPDDFRAVTEHMDNAMKGSHGITYQFHQFRKRDALPPTESLGVYSIVTEGIRIHVVRVCMMDSVVHVLPNWAEANHYVAPKPYQQL